MPRAKGFQTAALTVVLAASAWALALNANTKQDTASTRRSPLFRTRVEMVVIRAAVTDPLNRYVIGLEKEHFKIFDNKVEQAIAHFSSDNGPLSAGIILDVSGSMSNNLLSARNSVVRFLTHGTSRDEHFLLGFNDHVGLVQGFTAGTDGIRNRLSFLQAKGRTALYDAIYAGLQKLSEARNEKKALIVITDGEDNSSRYTFSDLKEFARETDAQIYVIGERGKLGYGPALISEIVSLTGGRAFFPDNLKALDYYVDLIHTELRTQYLLGYIPTHGSSDGKWHKVQVRLEPPPGLPKLTVRAKEGYYAPDRQP